MKKYLIFLLLALMLSGCAGSQTGDIQKLIYKNYETFYNIKEKIAHDTQFDTGSNIDSITLSQDNLENLYILAKIWGYLKYYHPNVSRGKYNWDYELFRLIPALIDLEDTATRDKILCNWLTGLGSFPTSDPLPRLDPDMYKMEINLDWIIDLDFNENLSRKLVNIKEGSRAGNYYFTAAPGAGNAVFAREKTYSLMTAADLDIGYRLLSLYRYWNTIEYFFPYKYLIDRDWDDVLKEYIPRFINCEGEKEYILLLLELFAEIQDGHGYMVKPADTIALYRGEYVLPVDVSFPQGQVVVTFHHFKPNSLTELRRGDIITKIDNEPVEDIIERNLKYIAGSHYEGSLCILSCNLLRSSQEQIHIEYIRKGENIQSWIDGFKSVLWGNSYLFGDHSTRDFFSFIDPSIAYIYPQGNMREPLDKIMKKIINNNTKALIIDLRCYPSVPLTFSLTECLLRQPQAFAKFTIPSLLNPGDFIFTEAVYLNPRSDIHYEGQVIVLLNEWTMSAAEYFVMALQTVPGVTLVGSKSAGADGNVSAIYLPGGIVAYMSGIGVYYPDGRETQRVGIIPDIEVKPTVRGIREGRDEVLEKALELIYSKIN